MNEERMDRKGWYFRISTRFPMRYWGWNQWKPDFSGVFTPIIQTVKWIFRYLQRELTVKLRLGLPETSSVKRNFTLRTWLTDYFCIRPEVEVSDLETITQSVPITVCIIEIRFCIVFRFVITLLPIIIEIYPIIEEYPMYGYRRVTVVIKKEGMNINHKRIQRLMRDNGLKKLSA